MKNQDFKSRMKKVSSIHMNGSFPPPSKSKVKTAKKITPKAKPKGLAY